VRLADVEPVGWWVRLGDVRAELGVSQAGAARVFAPLGWWGAAQRWLVDAVIVHAARPSWAAEGLGGVSLRRVVQVPAALQRADEVLGEQGVLLDERARFERRRADVARAVPDVRRAAQVQSERQRVERRLAGGVVRVERSQPRAGQPRAERWRGEQASGRGRPAPGRFPERAHVAPWLWVWCARGACTRCSQSK
jgi:hypothetical protein